MMAVIAWILDQEPASTLGLLIASGAVGRWFDSIRGRFKDRYPNRAIYCCLEPTDKRLQTSSLGLTPWTVGSSETASVW